jgi:hypothetical protein
MKIFKQEVRFPSGIDVSETIGSGFSEAVKGGIGGFIVSAFLQVIATLPSLPSYYAGIFRLFEVVSLVGGILLIFAMETWGCGYLLGWLFGMWVASTAGLVESWLFTIYAIVGAVVLFGKILEKAEGFLRNL